MQGCHQYRTCKPTHRSCSYPVFDAAFACGSRRGRGSGRCHVVGLLVVVVSDGGSGGGGGGGGGGVVAVVVAVLLAAGGGAVQSS